ncbi:MAG: replication-associated recombination protein A [Bacteroidota bacterium]|jgi:putative ATPase|nr:replication-associated recombination protein A [Sphingobacteriales bacterium]
MTNIKPLAERVRPTSLSSYIGQEHLTGEGAPLYLALKQKFIPSMIFWGPPGVGKTTLAKIIGQELGLPYYQLSAISAGVAEVRKIIEEAKNYGKVLLFLDEIHGFNKSQQDALLGAVENGNIILIGATTENPSFEVNNALLSRCQVYLLKQLEVDSLLKITQQAIEQDEVLGKKKFNLNETEALLAFSGGDARKLLNILELIANQPQDEISITNESITALLQQRIAMHDKDGEAHYDTTSAFIKSIRGSDPNAAVYWLARLLNGGEDIKFIARRMIILASEDIGNANPTALVLATNCMQAIQMIGMPEARIILSQCATYLAASPKSNSAYTAITDGYKLVINYGELPVPLHLRNAPNKFMKSLDYGKEYVYAHHHENSFTEQEFMPQQVSGSVLYKPGKNQREEEMRLFLNKRWKDKYNY